MWNMIKSYIIQSICQNELPEKIVMIKYTCILHSCNMTCYVSVRIIYKNVGERWQNIFLKAWKNLWTNSNWKWEHRLIK